MSRMSLNDSKLYLILDKEVNSYGQLFEIAKKAMMAGADIIQLRDKYGSAKDILNCSKRILEITKGKIPYIVNDRVDLAIISGSSGVHLGQDDVPVRIARKMMGDTVIIGVSCQTYAHAVKAQDEGADYIGFGSVFKTLTKPNRNPMDIEQLKKVFENIKIPVFAIGGINLENAGQLKADGINRIAVCRAVCEAGNVNEAVRQLKAGVDGMNVA